MILINYIYGADQKVVQQMRLSFLSHICGMWMVGEGGVCHAHTSWVRASYYYLLMRLWNFNAVLLWTGTLNPLLLSIRLVVSILIHALWYVVCISPTGNVQHQLIHSFVHSFIHAIHIHSCTRTYFIFFMHCLINIHIRNKMFA